MFPLMLPVLHRDDNRGVLSSLLRTVSYKRGKSQLSTTNPAALRLRSLRLGLKP